MRAVLQRVRRGRVLVDEDVVAEIGRGIVILLGVGREDTEKEASWLANKCANLRIFEDTEGKTNLSVQAVGGGILVVSQFTLYADTRKGRRPSFINAGAPELAEPLVAAFAQNLTALGLRVERGVFGAHMVVDMENDGPVTILLERESA
ncbi:MAG: D-aminoacyl-tRNA deacylase [Anaerolineales bacterium]